MPLRTWPVVVGEVVRPPLLARSTLVLAALVSMEVEVAEAVQLVSLLALAPLLLRLAQVVKVVMALLQSLLGEDWGTLVPRLSI